MKILSTSFRIVFIFGFALFMSSTKVFSQAAPKDFKNSIKFNVSNTLLYDNSLQFSYERMIKENQSINVFAGYQEFPLITLDVKNVDFDQSSGRKGYSFGADYRFYLGSVNKYKGPRGVYLAPFTSFFSI